MANKEKLLASAQKFLSKGQVPKAISEYQKLVDAFPKDVRNRQKLAELLSRDKRNDDALTEYEAVAKHYTDTGFYLKSIAVFKQMQKIEPSRVDIYHRLAELNEKQGLVGNALTEYRNLVSFYEKNGMHQEAIEVLEKMAGLDPDNLNFAAKIAECYMVSGQNEPALDKFQEIIEPLAAKGEDAKIVKLYERFLDICPEEGLSRLPLAQALTHSGSSDKAIQVLKSLLQHSPENADIHRCLTDAYVASQDFANARLTLKHLLKQNEEDLDLREYYVRICIDAGEVERARDRLEDWKDAFFQAERVIALQGFYEELRELLPGDAVVSETLSVIYETVGDTPKQDELKASTIATAETVETADAALLDEAIDDVETLEMVGEEAAADFEVPSLETEDAKNLPAEKTAAVGIELDLDLDLDLGVAETQGDEIVPSVEDEAVEGQEKDFTAVVNDDEDVEVELDLDDMGDFDLDFEDDEVVAEEQELSLDAEVESGAVDLQPEGDQVESLDVAVADTDAPVEEEALDDVAEQAAFDGDEEVAVLTEDAVAVALEETGLVEELEAFADPQVPEEIDAEGALEEVEALEEIEELEALEEVEELEEIEELEALEEVEDLEEIEELEALEEVEELEALEESAASGGETFAGQSDFAAALNVDAELEEAEFYLQQGLYDDAERVVQTLMEYRPESPEIQAKMDAINQGRKSAETESSGAVFVDVMADLQDDDLLAATDFLDSFGRGSEVDDDLSQKLVSELDSADTESHYNLGIAYKEMGLYDDAVAEFEKAGIDPVRTLDCIILTGQCHMEAGETDAAMTSFKSGLAHESLNDESRMTLNFELGMLHQMNGQLLEALECFQLVAEKDSFFRDVSVLIKNLRNELDLDDDSDDDGGPQGNRDRVSYV